MKINIKNEFWNELCIFKYVLNGRFARQNWFSWEKYGKVDESSRDLDWQLIAHLLIAKTFNSQINDSLRQSLKRLIENQRKSITGHQKFPRK